MFSPLLAGPAAPATERSVLPALKGLPWWGAVLLAVGATTIGALIDTDAGSSLGRWFKLFYLAGCLLAALAVRQRALFTAAAQPPLVAFIVGVTVLYTANSGDGSLGMRDLILKVVLPTAYSFPWILLTFLMTLAVVVARWFLVRPKGQALFGKAVGRAPGTRTRTGTTSRAPKPAEKNVAAKKVAARKSAAAKSTAAKPATATKPATAKTASPKAAGLTTAGPAKTAATAKTARTRTEDARSARSHTDRPAPSRRSAAEHPAAPTSDRPRRRSAADREGRPGVRPTARATEGEAARGETTRTARPARPQKRPTSTPRPAPSNAAETNRRAAPQMIPARDPRIPRKTAGQLRDTGAIEDLTADADER